MTDIAAPISSPAVTTGKLPSIKSLFLDSINLYRSGWKTFLLVILLPVLALIISEGLIIALILLISGGDVNSQLILVIPPAVVGLVIFLVVNAIAKITLVKAIDMNGQAKFMDLLNYSKPIIGKYILLQLLVGVIVLVATVLLIIPGIIAMILLLFAPTILIIENIGGVEALKRSRSYVKGKFWGILLRVFVLTLVAGVIAYLSTLVENQILNSLIQLFSSFVVAPISAIYTFKLYQAAKA